MTGVFREGPRGRLGSVGLAAATLANTVAVVVFGGRR